MVHKITFILFRPHRVYFLLHREEVIPDEPQAKPRKKKDRKDRSLSPPPSPEKEAPEDKKKKKKKKKKEEKVSNICWLVTCLAVCSRALIL